MASKFQNRLVGTVILVALGVIILPGLLDGKKKHYEDEFAAIPLVPKPGDVEENTMLPPVTQPLLATPTVGAEALVEHQVAPEVAVQQAGHQNTPPPPPVHKPMPLPTPVDVKPDLMPKPKPAPVQKSVKEQAPVGQAYVVQLGALKNATRVDEIVSSLRLSGYRVFTVPSTPVQGQLTRIYVGPDASKQKLQSSLSALNAISGLSGQVKPYSVR
ncbi:cell division protein DedD [Serratia symbiotica]|uniref:cell division protein DedD n=1 Tax=Serratia symbiotica TaxID=138074 RepID=UPI001D4F488A|nr:cell division protein DedD [Serratia symbiotica]NIG87376.1 cell division protein DedD [Serratia symbiotica]USS95108.1 cell division protein DedD [Serratia symbiotica]